MWDLASVIYGKLAITVSYPGNHWLEWESGPTAKECVKINLKIKQTVKWLKLNTEFAGTLIQGLVSAPRATQILCVRS
jgi:hypothetical protein